jgi:hypothetical protein
MQVLLAVLLLIAGPADPFGGPSVPFLAGLAPGAQRSEVIAHLGPPISTVAHPSENELGMGRISELRYSGLSVWVCYPLPLRRSSVFRIAASSPRWQVSGGLRVGHSRTDVLRHLGEPTSSYVQERTGHEVLRYSRYRSFDGWLDITIDHDHVTVITFEDDWS